MAQLINKDAGIETIQPVLNLLEKFKRRLFREVALLLGKGDGDFQFFRQCKVNWKDRAYFGPFCLSCGLGPHRHRVECRSSFVHGCITQAHSPCVNLTATAFRPSWYCTATTVASAVAPARASRCTRTWSSNSSGSFEIKIACCAPPNSKIVASRSLAPPPRSEVTCTGTRTGAEPGKKRASCPAQSTSGSMTATSVERFTQPLAYRRHSSQGSRACTHVPPRNTVSRR